MRRTAQIALCLITLLASGCESLYFYPSDREFVTPQQLNLSYRDLSIEVADDTRVHAWLLEAQGERRGRVYYLHGNAQNISAHIANVHWLPRFGYEVFMLDYRGYGRSQGTASIAHAFQDIDRSFAWYRAHSNGEDDTPLFVFGQSLGASLALSYFGRHSEPRQALTALVADSAFTGFRRIARDKMASSWLLWPFQYPLGWLFPSRHAPIDALDELADMPKLFTYSRADRVIPGDHGDRLYHAAPPPKRRLVTHLPHTSSYTVPEHRACLVAFFKTAAAFEPGGDAALQGPSCLAEPQSADTD